MPEPEEQEVEQEEETPEVETISKDLLPEELRDKSPDQIRAFFDMQKMAAQSRTDELREMRQRLAQLEDSRAAQPEPEEPEEEFEIDEDEWIKNPREAVQKLRAQLKREQQRELQKVASPALEEQRELAKKTAILTAQQNYPDWGEVKDDVLSTIEEVGAPVNELTIQQAYLMRLGNETLKERRSKDRKVQGEKPPKPKPEKEKPELSENERAAAARWGMTEDEWREWQTDDVIEMDIRTGAKSG